MRHTRRHRSPFLPLTVASALCAPCALARPDTPPAPPPSSPTAPEQPISPDDLNLLRGPAVGESQKGPRTLVERDMDGRLKRLDGSPEEEAFRLLESELTPAQRDACEQILAERARAYDELFDDNTALILELQGYAASEGWQGEKTRDALRRLAAKAPGVEQERAWRDRLFLAMSTGAPGDADEMMTTRPPPGEEARRLADEYRAAALEDARAEGDAAGRAPARAAALERIRDIGREIKGAYERRSDFNNARLEETLAELSLTPEQDAKVRSAIITFAQKQRLKTTTPADKLDLYRSLSETLTQGQMRRLFELTRGRARSDK